MGMTLTPDIDHHNTTLRVIEKGIHPPEPAVGFWKKVSGPGFLKKLYAIYRRVTRNIIFLLGFAEPSVNAVRHSRRMLIGIAVHIDPGKIEAIL